MRRLAELLTISLSCFLLLLPREYSCHRTVTTQDALQRIWLGVQQAFKIVHAMSSKRYALLVCELFAVRSKDSFDRCHLGSHSAALAALSAIPAGTLVSERP